MDASTVACPCEEHALCTVCVEDTRRNHVRTPARPVPTCPCGAGGPLFPDPPPAPQETCSLSDKEIVLDLILTNRCPHCNIPFEGYDACSALFCPCGNWFCGLCLTPCMGRDDAHAHVQRCPRNPRRGSYYVPEGEIGGIERGRKLDFLSAFVSEMSIIHAMLLLFQVRAQLGTEDVVLLAVQRLLRTIPLRLPSLLLRLHGHVKCHVPLPWSSWYDLCCILLSTLYVLLNVSLCGRCTKAYVGVGFLSAALVSTLLVNRRRARVLLIADVVTVACTCTRTCALWRWGTALVILSTWLLNEHFLHLACTLASSLISSPVR